MHHTRCLSVIKPPNLPQVPEVTADEVVQTLTESIIGGPNTYDPVKYESQRRALMDLLPSSQEELPPRKMIDSFDQVPEPLDVVMFLL